MTPEEEAEESLIRTLNEPTEDNPLPPEEDPEEDDEVDPDE